jgi:acyl transferase domain-containing protein/acyl carrier protein
MSSEPSEAVPSGEDGLDALLQQKYEPIAIVGVGLRFPGGSESLDEFDEFLAKGSSGISSLPSDRWDVTAFTPEGPDDRGKIQTTGGGFLDRIDLFDPMFFNISPKEAQYIDPQQRMLLETAWQALENANIDPTSLRRGNGGVYIGASSIDYALELDSLPYTELDGLLASGITMFPLSGRISYFLGWRGPSASIDTACSSSLTALHMAVQGLRSGETDIALCGGVNALHHPRISVVFSHANMLAPDGLCKTFDDGADGYVRAEGCAVIVLKRLSTAQRDNDDILAIVRGTAVGQDGDSVGLTVPNGTAQEIVMRNAIKAARLTPGDVSYVEAHGTGTPLGDPIELGAINDVFSDSHDKQNPLVVGSVKTNLGHMEPASGLVGLIKVVAQLRSATIYPHLNLTTPSGRIPWDRYPIEIPVVGRSWSAPIRRALVNSFGFAGAIAAVVLEQAPQPAPRPAPAPSEQPPSVLTVSAKSAAALAAQLAEYQQYAADRPDLDAGQFCATGNIGRAHFKHRAAAVVTDRASLVRALDQQAARTDRPEPTTIRKTGFLFSGQGSQYAGMGAALYRQYPVFARWVDECDQLFGPLLTESVRALLLGQTPEPELIHQTGYTQPALFTLEYALAKLWLSWGVQPGVLIGHSIGEVVAATVAGVFSLADAVTLVAARGRLMQSVSTPGGMAAVSAAADELTGLLADYPDLALAAINAPDQCVISGGLESLATVSAVLTDAGVRVEQLAVSHAFHSPLMTEVYDEFLSALEGIAFNEPTLSIVSNVTGKLGQRGEFTDPHYWVRHIGSPVLFQAGLAAGVRRGRHALIEIGPSTALTSLAGRCLGTDEHLWLASLRRRDTGGDTIVKSLAAGYLGGLSIDWRRVHGDDRPDLLTLPTYRFQRKRYWLPNGGAGRRRATAVALTSHPLLGEQVSAGAADDGYSWQFDAEWSTEQPGYLAEHLIADAATVPIAAYIETIMAAQDAIWGHTGRVVTDLSVGEPLVLSNDEARVRTTVACWPGADQVEIRIESALGEVVTEHARATLSTEATPLTPGDGLWQHLYDRGPVTGSISGADLYTDFASVGRHYGPAFRLLTTVDCHPAGVLAAELTCRPVGPVEQLPVEVVEAALQALAAADLDGVLRSAVGMQSVRMFKKPRGSQLQVVAQTGSEPTAPGQRWTADLLILEGRNPVAELRGVVLERVGAVAERQHFEHQLSWLADERQLPRTSQPRHVLTLNSNLPALADAACQVSPLADLAELPDALEDRSVTDVCWFWRRSAEPVSSAALRAECERNYRELLQVIGDLEASPPSRRLRLWLVTRGAQLLPGDRPDDGQALAASTLWGFGRVLLNEHPRYSATLVDLDPAGDSAPLVSEWESDSNAEFQLAYRGRGRQVRRVQPVAVAEYATEGLSDTIRLRPDRTYLITGGLGGLGLVTARKLVELGARDLTLVSRRAIATPEATAVLDQLSERATVRLLRADLGAAEDVRQLFADLRVDAPPMGGIVHAAGEIGQSMISGLTWEAIDEQLAPKVYGGWALHEASRDLTDLEFFVLYTSIAGVIGGLTQAHYSAASTYGDALAVWRRASGLPALAVDWGAWAGVGMSARLDPTLSRQVELGGIGFFSPTRALRALSGLLSDPTAHRIVGQYDWDVIATAGPISDALYSEVARPAQRAAAGLDIAALVAKPKEERLAVIAGVIRATVAAALQYDEPESLDTTAELLSLGLDSLMSMEVKRGLEATFGLILGASLTYDYPTVKQLTDFVNGQLLDTEGSSS